MADDYRVLFSIGALTAADVAGLFFTSPLLLAWLGCFWLARELAGRRCVDPDWRLSWLFACLGFGSLLTIIVEVASLAHCLNRSVVCFLWLVADLILFGTAIRLWLRRNSPIALGEQKAETPSVDSWDRHFRLTELRRLFQVQFKQKGAMLLTALRIWPAGAKWLLGVTGLLGLFLFFVALLTPTTNIDSIGYHLPRMMQWIQQGSVNHFPTDDLRQLEFGPWSSFMMTNLFLLSGNDQLLNLAQMVCHDFECDFGNMVGRAIRRFCRKAE